MSRVVHFEVPADNPERAARFYATVFGWKVTKWAGPVEYWLAVTGDEKDPGIDGGILRRGDPVSRVVNTMNVSSVDEALKKVAAAGGKVVVPKHAIPEVGYQAYFQDTEGNVFGVHQRDTSAR